MLSRLFCFEQFNHNFTDRASAAQDSSASFLFDTKNRCGFERVMLYGPELSGKTSLLFELAMSFADEGKHVLYISPKKISKLPLLAHGRTQPTSVTLNYIQVVYLETREEYLNYMASIHFSTSRPFSAVIIDGINAFVPSTIKKEDLSSVAKVFALTVDSFLFQKSKRTSETSEEEPTMLVISMTVPRGTKSLTRQVFYERWIQCFLCIQEKESELFELSLLPSNIKDSSTLANVSYKINDHSFIVQDIEYSSQSDSGFFKQ